MMGCPPDLAANEDRIAQLFSEPVKLSREGDALALRSGRGELQLAPVTDSAGDAASQPAGTVPDTQAGGQLSGSYTLTELRRDGQVLETSAFVRPVTLSFTRDAQGRATLGGSDGCNAFGGAYEWTGDSLRLNEPSVGTLMFCAGTENLPSLSAALNAAPTLTRSGDTLTLSSGGVDWVFRHD